MQRIDWWARRPPSLMRSILLAAVMDGEVTATDLRLVPSGVSMPPSHD